MTFKNRPNFMSSSWAVRGSNTEDKGIGLGHARKDELLADKGLGVNNIHAVQSYRPLYNKLNLRNVSYFYSNIHVLIESRVYMFYLTDERSFGKV